MISLCLSLWLSSYLATQEDVDKFATPRLYTIHAPFWHEANYGYKFPAGGFRRVWLAIWQRAAKRISAASGGGGNGLVCPNRRVERCVECADGDTGCWFMCLGDLAVQRRRQRRVLKVLRKPGTQAGRFRKNSRSS